MLKLPEPVPVEEIVTCPLPLSGDIIIFDPANNWVTPPFNAYDALVALLTTPITLEPVIYEALVAFKAYEALVDALA